MRMRRIGAGLVALTVAASCTVGPQAQQPTSPAAGTPQEAPAGAPATSPVATAQAGSLSCAQLLTTCYDGHCTTQECMDSCAAAGTAAARSLNAALWGCIRAASCADVPCVENRCPDQLAACERDGGVAAGPPAGTPPPGRPVQPAGPQDLVGDWHYGSVSSTGYYDATTGSWASPTGSGAMLTITSDGRFEKAGLIQTTTYGCTMRYSQWAEGSVTVQGDTLVLTEEKAQHKMADTCGKDWDKPKKLETRTFRWRLEPDDRGVMALKLVDPDGSEQAYFH